jgi:hypothetical protein
MRGFSFTLPTNASSMSQKGMIQALAKRSEVGYVFQDYIIMAVGNPGEQPSTSRLGFGLLARAYCCPPAHSVTLAQQSVQ